MGLRGPKKTKTTGRPNKALPKTSKAKLAKWKFTDEDFAEDPHSLSPRAAEVRLRFVEEYIANGERSGKAAAQKVGVAASKAQIRAWQWMKAPDVKEFLAKYRAARAEVVVCDAAKVFEEALAVAHSNLQEIISMETDGKGFRFKRPQDIPEYAWRAIKSISTKVLKGKIEGIEIKVELYDKVRALHLIAQSIGLLDKTIKITGKMDWHEVVKDSDKPSKEVLEKMMAEAQGLMDKMALEQQQIEMSRN